MLTTEINDGEAALAVVGMKAVLSRKVEKITAEQRREMKNYGKAVEKYVKALFADEVKCAWPELPTYKFMLDATSETVQQGQIEEMISVLPPQTQTDFVILAGKIYKALQATLPKRISVSLSGTEQLTIDDPTYFAFCNQFRVLNNPMQVLELASSAALLRTQCDVIRASFPTISAAMDEAIQNAVTDRKKNDPIPHLVELGLSVWLSLPTYNGNFDAVYAPANKVQQKTPSPSEAQLSPESAMTVSPADAAQFPKAT